MAEGQRIAIVTGAGSGIGKAAALALLREGWSVVLAGRRQDALDEVAAVAKDSNARSLVVPTDVRDPDSIHELFARTKAEFGRLDLLFNNAGVGSPPAPLEDLPQPPRPGTLAERSRPGWMMPVSTRRHPSRTP